MSKTARNDDIERATGSTPRPGPTGDLSPLQLTALTALAIFAGEALIMLVMPVFRDTSVVTQALIDSVLLTLVTAPVLSFLLFRPMVVHINERKAAERALRELNKGLEDRVEARTEELARSNRALQREIHERKSSEERIRRTNDFVQRLVESAPCLMATIDVNSLRCNYVNGRIEDFLGLTPEQVTVSGGTLLDVIVAPESIATCRELIRKIADAPQGEIVRSRCQLKSSEGEFIEFRVGFAVVSRTAIGETEEVLFVATPVDRCS
jgi:PAS domain S-box-containing protein